ncbi:MAG: non-canonical purine NTP pyrophosphatase [Clostridia bacterium]|nr:non-canonical purine NTP pyrophosphatase [Clostridia bacterium]
MDILIGTTNPAKINRFSKLLNGYAVRILTPNDLGIHDSPEENGKNPIENACIKAAYYAKFCSRVICNDSGLYFSDLPFDDPRQPGLHIRTPQGKRLDDEEMIAHYAQLAHDLGGRITAYYLDAIAVCANGVVSSYKDSENALQDGAFYLLDTPSPKRTPGWPLDSLAVNRKTGFYFVDSRSDAELPESRIRAIEDQRNFLINALQLK